MKRLLVLLVLLASARFAIADDQPWARGVTQEQKDQANKFLDEGNELLLANQYKEALAKYNEAIAVWDHPAIRFNMVRALISLDRMLEAAENLDKALAYGRDPLDDIIYREALNYQHLLASQLATIEVSCTQAGVKLSLDGAPLMTCPGSKSVRTTAGTHALAGRAPTLLAKTYDLVVLPGKSANVAVSLESIASATRTRTRWAVWKPWVVVGGGATLVGVGVLLEAFARSNLDDYHARLASPSCQPAGCMKDDPILVDTESRMKLENRIGIGAIATGGAVVVTGLALVVLNRSYAYVPDQSVRVTPTASADRVGVQLQLDF